LNPGSVNQQKIKSPVLLTTMTAALNHSHTSAIASTSKVVMTLKKSSSL